MLSSIWDAMIAGLRVKYEFDIREFLDQEMTDRDIWGEKSLLVYPCVIIQIFLVMGIQEILILDEMLEATNTTDLGMI